MLAPSKATPTGFFPTVKVPIKGQPEGALPHRANKRCDGGLIPGSPTVHVVVAVIRYPDIGPVKDDAIRAIPRSERRELLAIVRPHLGHDVAVVIRHPDIGPVKGYADGAKT